ncbi:hypothetical protein [Chroococcidiopsis sp. CCMEE 29]|uniref:hypothetical protein n=1 Tax=Chroococcidiopsis sp. CCMEE 29 TaxID=155894 RepID=UPI002020AE0E|nr:hypothetical protein [Chroococcidiopsis sp. CCMEE 29]
MSVGNGMKIFRVRNGVLKSFIFLSSALELLILKGFLKRQYDSRNAEKYEIVRNSMNEAE